MRQVSDDASRAEMLGGSSSLASFVHNASVAKRTLPGSLLAALLVICLFAPYGTLPFANGTLRVDHLAVHTLFLWALATGRLRVLEPLAKGYAAFVVVVLLGTVLHSNLIDGPNAMPTIKNVDGLMRGLEVLLLASSMRATRRDAAVVLVTLSGVIVVLSAMATLERLAPDSALVRDTLVPAYGGPVQDGTLYSILGQNHKALLLEDGRASAVFVTPPALSMVSVIAIPAIIIAPLNRRARWAALLAALVAGLASNSKSFLFGVPVALIAWSLLHRQRHRGITASLLLVALGATFLFAFDHYFRSSFDPLQRLQEASDDETLSVASGGRIGSPDSTIFTPIHVVLSQSPLVGFGFGMRPGVNYADSALNRLLLHGGLFGMVIFLTGCMAQIHRFYARARASQWAALGATTMTMFLAFFTAGAVYMMPRVNDVIFTLIGISAAMHRADA